MKKILTHLTGIVFLITILIAGGCGPAKDPQRLDHLEEVTIYVKAVIIKGENHLEMYDSNDPTIVVVDTLHTKVKDGTKVFWKLADSSGLKKVRKVVPKNSNGNIMPGPATGFWFFTKYKKHKVPDDQTPGDEQEYLIEVKDEENNEWGIDPHLKIPDE